jgi:hypothetical protein
MRIFIGVLSAALLSGCVSYTSAPKTAKPAPADRVLAFKYVKPGYATMIVTRDDGYMAGGGCYAAVLVDGMVAARLGTGETVSLHLPPGRHVYGIAGDDKGQGLCGLKIAQPQKESSSDFAANDLQRYRISGNSSESWLDIRPTTLDTGTSR